MRRPRLAAPVVGAKTQPPPGIGGADVGFKRQRKGALKQAMRGAMKKQRKGGY